MQNHSSPTAASVPNAPSAKPDAASQGPPPQASATDPPRTEVACILDRSGSMAAIREDAVGGLNAFLADRRAEPDAPAARFSLTLFNQEVERVFDGVALADAPDLAPADYRPAGMTALLDAVGSTLEAMRTRHDAMPPERRPEQVIVAIITDGLENASSDYDLPRVRAMIEGLRAERGWEILFLAANQDAIAEGARMGVAAGDSAGFAAEPGRTGAAISMTSLKMRAKKFARIEGRAMERRENRKLATEEWIELERRILQKEMAKVGRAMPEPPQPPPPAHGAN